MKLFGKNLFSFKKEPEDPYMYDFAQHGLANEYGLEPSLFFEQQPNKPSPKKGKKTKIAPPDPKLTAKEVFQTGTLNNNSFTFGIGEDYIQNQIEDMKNRLDFYPKARKVKYDGREYAISHQAGASVYGQQEMRSMIERLENRRRISAFKDVLEKYPYTSTFLVNKVVKDNPDLRCRKADDFIPDFPKEAIVAMKEYNKMCEALCGKKTLFYVIANKEDFGEVSRRRDPILLAQSPFGFFWQILGAWDEEMQYLGDL